MSFHEKSDASQKLFLRITRLAAAFYDDFPGDVRRLQAREIFLSERPSFVTKYAFVEGFEYRKWSQEQWAAYLHPLPRDLRAQAEWLATSERMVADAARDPGLTAADKEGIEWLLFMRYLNCADDEHKRGEPVDWSQYDQRFEAYMLKYPQLEVLGSRAGEYYGALEKKLGEEAATLRWRQLLARAGSQSAAPGFAAIQTVAQAYLAQRAGFAAGQRFEQIKFTAVDGKKIDVAKMRGKVVLVDFWAMWCGPCVRELPNVKAVYEKYRDRGFEVVGVSGDKGSKEQLVQFLRVSGYTWPQHFDGLGTLNQFAVLFDVRQWPTTYLLGPDGALLAEDVRGAKLEPAIRRALGLTP